MFFKALKNCERIGKIISLSIGTHKSKNPIPIGHLCDQLLLNKKKHPVEAFLTPFLSVLSLLVHVIELKSKSISASA